MRMDAYRFLFGLISLFVALICCALITVDEFISLTKDDYGRSVILNMATKRRENNAQ